MEMNLAGKGSGQQPKRLAWSLERLENERANFRSSYLDKSTLATYKSGLNSYLAFCERHNFDINPTLDTLSFFIAYMARQTGPSGRPISIRTITSYLSGITFYLEPSYPHVRDIRKLPIISQTIQDRKSTRLNSSHTVISYAVFCLKKKKHTYKLHTTREVVGSPVLRKDYLADRAPVVSGGKRH